MTLFKKIKKSLGPGIVTGIADDDPSGIATYAQTGAIFGLSQLWMTLYSFPLMVAVQEMCARIGIVTGKGIAGVIKGHYPHYVLVIAVTLLTLANVINIGADLGAMGQAITLMTPSVPSGVGIIIITLFTIFSVIYIPYHKYAKILKYFAATVLAYIVTAFFITQDWQAITFATFAPHFEWNKEYLLNITAFLGTTISPYLFFWQADEEVEEEIEHKKLTAFGKGTPAITKNDLVQMRIDTVIGMFLSNLIAFFIIITAHGTIGGSGTAITSAAQFAESLRPLAGDFAVYLFSFGILGTGLLAIPVLAGSVAYSVAEMFSFPLGLNKTFTQAVRFYLVITIAILMGVLLNFLHIDPVLMLYYAAAVNGVLAAPLLVIILFVANNKKILGDKVNSRVSNMLVILTTVLMGAISLFTIESLIQ